MNLMLRTVGGRSATTPEERKHRDKEVVKKVLEENEKFRTRMGFYDPGEPRPDQLADIAKHLHIYPDEIIFKDITENQTYEINIMVRNLTKAVKRIRVLQPTTPSKFRCDYDMTGLLAPGLAFEIVVSFCTTTHGQFHDKIVILSDMDYRAEIPLHAYSPMANIIFEPFVNMGFIPVHQEKRVKVRFKNEGSSEGSVDLRFTDLPDFKIEPKTTFKIKPNGATHEVDFVYFPREAGIFRGIVEVYQEGQAFMNHIDVNATSVEFLKFVVDSEGNELSKVDFGTVFFGQKKEIRGYLVNNSPQPFKFKVNFISGLFTNFDEKTDLKTPAEEGQQMTQRIMTISPSEGIVDTYSQIPITFSCSSKVQEDHIIWVRNNCFRKTRAEPNTLQGQKKQLKEDVPEFDDKSKKNHEYTARFGFEGQPEPKMLMMTATCVCPKVSFGEESHFDFGTIRANETEKRKIDISNMHTDMDVVIDFPNVSVFYVEPSTIALRAGEKVTVKIVFRPRSLGKFVRKVEFMINKRFNVPITFVGTASQIAAKPKMKGGIMLKEESDDDSDSDFLDRQAGEVNRKQGELSEAMPKLPGKATRDVQKAKSKTAYPFKPNPNLMRLADTTQESQLPLIPSTTQNPENYDQYQIQKFNSKVANDYLTEQRLEREMMKKKGYIVGQNKMRKDRIAFYAGKPAITQAEFSAAGFGKQDKLERPKMNIPGEADTLFVMKPISSYEPYAMYDYSANFTPDFVRGEDTAEDKQPTHAELRDITSELTGEELQKIHVGPTRIDFGTIFVKSSETRYFQIKNDLRKSISARVSIENHSELGESSQKTKIIQSGKSASFRVSFCSMASQTFEHMVTYTINERHHFKIFVRAEVTAVNLKLSKAEEEFVFEDEQLDMKLVKDILIINDGNAVGSFEWRESRSGCYTVSPTSGDVQPRSSFPVKVTYTPSGTKLVEEDDLYMDVVDGDQRRLACKATLSEVKCEFSNKTIDFGIMCVSDRRILSTILTNELMKSSVVFQVDAASLPAGLEISPINDRIPPGSPCRFELTYCNSNVAKLHNREVKINLRGAPPALLYINAETLIPSVRIKEEEFNFGEVTYGNTESLKMTLVNESEIDIFLTLDLREREDSAQSELYSRLDIRYQGDQDGEDDQVLEEKDLEDIAKPEFKSLKEIKQDDLLDESMEEEANQREGAHPAEGSKYYSIKLKKRKTYEFELRFSPKLDYPKTYSFDLPITLAGFSLQSLKRKVICRGIFPKLTMEPINGEVVFEKKIITSLDSVVPQYASVTFTNSQHSKPLQFRIDTAKLSRPDIFDIIPTSGTIDPQVPVTIKVSFKPQGNEKYVEELPLHIEEDSKPYTTIRLVGEGAYPKLLFDRREVIMPVVPLGVESRCSFKIENEGYQNLILKHYLAQDIGAIKLKVETPDGKTLGSGTNVIRVDLSFSNDKPISFTTKLIFEDEAKQIYPIFVSGTTDNSLLTNYPFFQVKGDEYRPAAEANKPIRLEMTEADMDSQLSPLPDGGHTSKVGGSVGSKSAKSSIGFTPIKMSDLEKSCDYCRDWLNNYVLALEISKFPDDVIAASGRQIYELIAFLTKRNPPQVVKIDPNQKKHVKVEQLHRQYADLIRHLKEAGAMLNTIRPEFLLGQPELATFYKKNPSPNVLPSANRITNQQFRYLSLDSWSTLFYQILKIYYECRITAKQFKAMKELPADKNLLPEIYQEPNPLYNQAELILLRWLELAVEKKFPGTTVRPRHINFDTDIKSGLGIGSLILMYIDSPTKKIMNLRFNINSQEDMRYNFDKIRQTLREYGISQPPEVFERPSAREILIYLMHLYQVLPFFIPRATLEFPVMLKGHCTRTIMLQNPSKRKICYSVKLDCVNDDFTIEKTMVEIEGGASVPFPVKYFARISKLNKARITFRNKKETGPQATPLVFDLVSEVQGRYNEVIQEVEPKDAQLYEPTGIEVVVTNPYSQAVNFHVKLENVPVAVEEPKKKRAGRKPVQDERVFIPAFFCKQDQLQIGKNGTAKLNVWYVPVTLEQHKCNIIFTDERIGEMQYELRGEPKLPAPMPLDPKASKFICQLDNLEPIRLDIGRHNAKMEYAFSKLKERMRESKSIPSTESGLVEEDRVTEGQRHVLP